MQLHVENTRENNTFERILYLFHYSFTKFEYHIRARSHDSLDRRERVKSRTLRWESTHSTHLLSLHSSHLSKGEIAAKYRSY
jgi:hypothetical protein